MADASNETEWAADRKVGFAMGILLVGVVAALFFRNEPLSVKDAPSVEREELIDSRLRDRDVAVYADDAVARVDNAQDPWAHPEILSEFGQRDADIAVPIGAEPGPTAAASATDVVGVRPAESRVDRSPLFQPPTEIRQEPTESAAPSDDFTVPEHSSDTPPADRPQEKVVPESYEEYTVRYGDTLSGIADRLLGSSGRYHEIYEANRDRMESPDRLTVGATIRIPR